MTRKQQAWLDSIAQGFPPDEAARRAGYRGDSTADFRRIGKRNQQRFARRPADDAQGGWQRSTGSAHGFAGRSEVGDSGSVGFWEGQNHSYKELKACADEIPRGEKTVPDEVLQEPVDGGVGDPFNSLKELKGSPKESGECPPESVDGCAGEQNNSYKELKGHKKGDERAVSEAAAAHTEPDWPGERSSELGWTGEEPLEKRAAREWEPGSAAHEAAIQAVVTHMEPDWPEEQPLEKGTAGKHDPEPAAHETAALHTGPDWPREQPPEKRAVAEHDPEPAALKNAGMDEIGAFWSAIIRDPYADRKDRLKASELLARACGGFLDRADLSGALTVVIYGDNFIPD